MKETFIKNYQVLFDFYIQKLQNEHEQTLTTLQPPVEYMITYLKFARDYYLATVDQDNLSKEEDDKISNLLLALDTYTRYLETPDTDLKKVRLWNAFWVLVACNIKDWSIAND